MDETVDWESRDESYMQSACHTAFFFFSNPLLCASGYRTPRSTSSTCTCELEQIYEYGS